MCALSDAGSLPDRSIICYGDRTMKDKNRPIRDVYSHSLGAARVVSAYAMVPAIPYDRLRQRMDEKLEHIGKGRKRASSFRFFRRQRAV